jgi:ATP-dependent DNA helicase DinG
MYDLNLIDQHFPFDNFRDGQKEAIEAILNAYNEGKKYVILEGPTGSGKSAIAMTVSNFFTNSYYLTIQKILQDQLTAEFTSSTIRSLKGRNAYRCNYWEQYLEIYGDNPIKMKEMEQEAKDPIIQKTMANPFCPASEGVCLVRDRRSKHDLCFPKGTKNLCASTCDYWKALGQSLESKTCIMNFHSFLYQTSVTDRFGPRDLLIIDEAHNTEPQLMDFVSLTVTDKLWRKNGVTIPNYDTAEEYADYFHQIKIHEKIEEIVRLAIYTRDFKRAEDWKKVLLQYNVFLNSVTSGDWLPKWENKGHYNKVTLKPIFVDKHSQQYLFKYGQKTLLMSATILLPKVIYESLGINPNEAFAYRMKNRFPPDNRPIYFKPSGSMSYKNKQNTLPILMKDVETICENYNNKKGIIHTHNFEISKYILHHGSKKLKKRLFYQEDFTNKDEMLQSHTNSENGIIIAPAMHEGLDLKDDLSRFQIICKVPYPSYQEDDQLKIRMQMSDDYYNWLTALKLIQSYGRSVRSETDWADTFILDSDFGFFQKKCKKILPQWFKEVILS